MITKWMRRRRAFITALLAMTVLFNSAHVFAAVATGVAHGTSSAMAEHMHDLQSPCCPDHSTTHNNCCEGTGCACMAHCASLFLAQTMPKLQNLTHAKPLVLAQLNPLPHIDPPPQRPPRA